MNCALAVCAVVGGTAGAALAASPLTYGFTYQGQLKQDGTPVEGVADLRFTLWDAASGGTADPNVLTRFDVPVTDGVFSTTLDFGAGAFDGSAQWLAIEVRFPAGQGSFVPLSTRQPVSAAPYALYALETSGGGSGGTLDQAYDHGGPGAGATITADSGPVTIAGPDGLSITGPVGVGTAEPEFELDVFDLDTYTGLPTTNPFDTRLGVRHDLNVIGLGVSHRWLYLKAGSDAALTRNSGADLRFQVETSLSVGAVPQMTLTSAGDLGIGTDTPKQRLHVNGDYYGRGHLYLYSYEGDGSSGTAYVQARDDSGRSNIDLRLRTQSAGTYRDVMTLDSSGRVGIGTTAPQTRLQVTGGTDVSPSSGGFIVAGAMTGPNVAIDDNEIMARNNGSAATLNLNVEGGDVVVGGSLDIGRQIVTASEGTTGDTAWDVQVTCPSGKHILGGGCRTDDRTRYVVESRPSGDTGWYCWFSPGDTDKTVTAYAICARVK